MRNNNMIKALDKLKSEYVFYRLYCKPIKATLAYQMIIAISTELYGAPLEYVGGYELKPMCEI